MNKIYTVTFFFTLFFQALHAQSDRPASAGEGQIVVISTQEGDLKIRLYPDVPRHTAAFLERAAEGLYDGTLFTRVLKDYIIQGGAPDSRNASPGARCGFGDRSAEILPEPNDGYFAKKGALAAPRQPDDINPQQKSDMSQFFIVQGKVYREGELDTLEMIQNRPIRQKALDRFYRPVKAELMLLKKDNPREYNKRARALLARVDSLVRATPGHLFFTPEQRKAYTTTGGCPYLDGKYVIFGEVIEGFDVIDRIAGRPTDSYDRPKQDVRIKKIDRIRQ